MLNLLNPTFNQTWISERLLKQRIRNTVGGIFIHGQKPCASIYYLFVFAILFYN